MSAILPVPIEPQGPLARTVLGAPLVFGALGFAFHLEPLVPDDSERLAKACERILEVVGAHLRWSRGSVHSEVEPFSGSVLDLLSCFPTQLVDEQAASIDDPRTRAAASAMKAARYDRFALACHGGAEPNTVSPWSLRFYSRTSGTGDPLLRADAMLSISMPATIPLEALTKLATAVAGILRIRWGAAGLVYGAWELDRYGETRAAIYAHARRHPGYDVGQHATLMQEFHDRVRTVSWLTFLGKDLTEQVRASGDALGSDELVTVQPCGEGVVLRAGDKPEAGDVNRRIVPRAYVRVDRRIRSVRASEGIHFYDPWSASTTEAWLRRFEDAPLG